MSIIVFISAIGRMALAGIYNFLLLLFILYFLYPQQGLQRVLVLFLEEWPMLMQRIYIKRNSFDWLTQYSLKNPIVTVSHREGWQHISCSGHEARSLLSPSRLLEAWKIPEGHWSSVSTGKLKKLCSDVNEDGSNKSSSRSSNSPVRGDSKQAQKQENHCTWASPNLGHCQEVPTISMERSSQLNPNQENPNLI